MKSIKNDPKLIILKQPSPHEIEAIYDDGSEEGIHYTCKYSEKYKMTTWNLKMEGQKFEINEFEKGAYHGPKTEGFIVRENLLMRSAERYIEKLNIHEEKKQEVKNLLNDLEKNFLDDIAQEDCRVDPRLMQDPDKKVSQGHYDAVHGKAQKLLAQLVRDLQFAIHEVSAKADPKSKKFDMHAFEQAEREYIVARGRPTILNTYFVEDSDKQFFSMQRPASAINEQGQRIPRDMLPSTVRDRAGLPNYVITSFGEVAKEDDNLKTTTLFEGIRHSSYPPIKIKDPIERGIIACENCKQNLTDITASILEVNPHLQTSRDEPLVIPLRAMMLLTPKKNIDKFRNHKLFIAGKWTGESETLQLEESAHALKMYNQRPIKLEIEGREVWIKPDISFMNVGANLLALKEGFFGALAPAQSELAYNAKGFVDFENEVFDFVGNLLKGNGKANELVKEISTYGNDPRLIGPKEKLEEIKKTHSDRIANLYAHLEQLTDNWSKRSPGSAERKSLEEQINSTQRKIEKYETEIYDRYKNYLGLSPRFLKQKKTN